MSVILLLTFNIFFVASEIEPKAPLDIESCQMKSDFTSLFVVGTFSSLVFCFIGILPAFFIRTDKDEEKFSKSYLLYFEFMNFKEVK